MKIYKTNDLQDCLMSFAFRNKYDKMANKLCINIFNLIKKNITGNFSYDNVEVKILYHETNTATFENFHIDANTQNNNIYITIFLNKKFSSKDYQRLNFIIYEVLRHELEHVDRYIAGMRPDSKYIELYHNLRNKHSNKKHVEMIAQYILSNAEINSYVKSIMYVAKKQNKSALEIVEQVIKRAFFGNNSDLMKEMMKNKKTVKIIDNVRSILKEKLKEYYPNFKEKWL